MITEENIIFEDDYILVVNKPANLLTVPTPQREKNTLTSCLEQLMNARGENMDVLPCHRLDRDTSGLIIFAKNPEAQQKMMMLFKTGQVKKAYIGFVQGIPHAPNGVMNFAIEGKRAITKYKVLQKRKGYSIIEFQPATGRTNQIRIHAKMMGHPILGERKFAFGKDFEIKFRRTALHAYQLQFSHPYSHESLQFICDIPDDMSRFIGSKIKHLRVH